MEFLPDGNRDTQTFSSMFIVELVLRHDCNLERHRVPLCNVWSGLSIGCEQMSVGEDMYGAARESGKLEGT